MQQIDEGHVRWLTFDHPERLNSFTVHDYQAFCAAMVEATTDPEVRVIVVTGKGRAFSAGADRSLLGGESGSTDGPRARAGAEFARFLHLLRECDKPLLAAVNGLAVGVGCTMLAYCDLVLAAESARFKLPFTAMGIVPEAGSSVLFPARARWDETMWAMLSSEWVSAGQARDMGLVWRVVADNSLAEETAAVAATIALHDPAAVAATKRLLVEGRSDAARLANDRELAAMSDLLRRRADSP
jgi:enoyl-CoA hydratase/carnithine racemase